MRKIVSRLFLFLLLIAFSQMLSAQTPSPSLPTNQQTLNTTSPNHAPATPAEGAQEIGESDIVRIDITLVTVPVSVMDRRGRYIPNLHKEDFRIYEDGVEQQIASFDPVEKPFTVVLLLDTSPSTNLHLGDIQEAAITFINQLRATDNVFAVSFDSQVHLLNTIGSDRESLRKAIRQTQTGLGTRLYDTVDLVMKRLLTRIPGRKAIVLFTDGWDTGSHATFKRNVRYAEELDALIYPIQYDAKDFFRPFLADTKAGHTTSVKVGNEDYTTIIKRANAYLNTIAQVTGGRLYHGDDLKMLTQAYTSIAEELGRQYSISYYPKLPAQAGQRRQIKVRVNQTDLVVKARDSYLKE